MQQLEKMIDSADLLKTTNQGAKKLEGGVAYPGQKLPDLLSDAGFRPDMAEVVWSIVDKIGLYLTEKGHNEFGVLF